MKIFPAFRSSADLPGRTTGQHHSSEGVAIIDRLLSELNPHDRMLLDAALDLRSAATGGSNAAACVEQLFRLRTLLGGRHGVAFMRVRHWAKRALRVEARVEPGAPWVEFQIPDQAVRIGEVVNMALARIAEDDGIPCGAQVRFIFTTDPVASGGGDPSSRRATR